jgi:hypothetical protein
LAMAMYGNFADDAAAAGNVATPGQLGQAGEAAVKAANDIGGKTRILVDGRVRIPDGLKPGVLSEVKNTASQSFTQQLRDFLNYAESNGFRMDLYTRPNTVLSGPLQEAIQAGRINWLSIPQ